MDIGDGKDLDLEELPRERLEREVITYVPISCTAKKVTEQGGWQETKSRSTWTHIDSYLSAEQRLNYLVKIDKDGLLRW